MTLLNFNLPQTLVRVVPNLASIHRMSGFGLGPVGVGHAGEILIGANGIFNRSLLHVTFDQRQNVIGSFRSGLNQQAQIVEKLPHIVFVARLDFHFRHALKRALQKLFHVISAIVRVDFGSEAVKKILPQAKFAQFASELFDLVGHGGELMRIVRFIKFFCDRLIGFAQPDGVLILKTGQKSQGLGTARGRSRGMRGRPEGPTENSESENFQGLAHFSLP